jgi:Tetratricopeptide repeat
MSSEHGLAWVKNDFETALAHLQAGRLAEASEIYRRILDHFPSHAETLHMVGVIALQQGRHDDAVSPISRAIRVSPARAPFHSNLGEAHRGLGQFDQAMACYRRALELQPDSSEVYNNIALALRTMGDLAEATRLFQRAVELNSDNANAHFNLGCIRLLQADFANGWHEYAWRMRMAWHPIKDVSLPAWDGLPLSGKKLLVYAEQGMGDTLQFIRYLPLVAPRAAEVVTIVPPELVPLLTASGVANLYPRGAPTPTCDAACPLLSLPALFGTTAESIPADIPYLRADARLVEHWRRPLESMSEFKVGIAWQGNVTYYQDRFRSIPLTAFEPLARVPGVRLFSLQMGDAARQIDELAGRFPLTRFDDQFDAAHGRFMDTAAVMMHLDLVVTSDTSIAHLAGALGVPVWLALSVSPDWRWMLERLDSPWYPSMRLFRQQQLGQWSDVFESIADAIAQQRQP